MLAGTQDQVGRRQLDWHRPRHTTTAWAPLRLLDLVGGAGLAVEAAPCRLLGHLLHLVDGDRHPGGRRLLLLPSLVVVPAVGQLRVRSTDVRHRVSQSELGWVGLVEEVVGEGFGASVKWSRTVGPEQAWKVPTDTHAHAPTYNTWLTFAWGVKEGGMVTKICLYSHILWHDSCDATE